MGKYCSNCGAEILEGAKFCSNCGASISDTPLEKNIGVNIEENKPRIFLAEEPAEDNKTAKKTKNKKGCGCLIAVAVVVIIGIIIAVSSSSTSNTKSSGSSTNTAYKSQEDIVSESLGVNIDVASSIVGALNHCGVQTVTSVTGDSTLDNMNKDGEKGYRVEATEVSNVILYMNPDNTVNMIRWNDTDLYSDGEQKATVTEVKNRPNLEVLSYSSENDGYVRYVVGEIRNNTKKEYSYVQVEISLYEDETLVGSTLDNVNNLEPGATWKFKAPIVEDNANKFKIKDVTGF